MDSTQTVKFRRVVKYDKEKPGRNYLSQKIYLLEEVSRKRLILLFSCSGSRKSEEMESLTHEANEKSLIS